MGGGALATLLAIYSTLATASLLAGVLYHQGFSAILFAGCLLLVGLTVLTQGLQTRPGGLEIGMAIGIAAVYLLVLVRLSIPERSDLMEYSVLAVFIYEALAERARAGRFAPVPPLLAIAATCAFGALDELIQLLLPHRMFEWTDILFNVLAAVMAVTGVVTLRGARRLATWLWQRGN